MICCGKDIVTGKRMTIEFDRLIRKITILEREHDVPEEDDVWISPGFVDLQVNGFAGVDFNNPHAPEGEIEWALEVIQSTGVTRCLPTLITASPDEMLDCLKNLARAKRDLGDGPVMAGFHIEGPHIGPGDGPRGAHPVKWVRPPDLEEFRRWQGAADGHIRLVTLSPHWPGSVPYIESLVGQGIVVSIGHTGANSAQIRAAVKAGATLSTHLGNAGDTLLPKTANYIWDQLAEERLSASFIVDGQHLGDSFLKACVRAKGVARSILVTDAAAPAGSAPGRYRLGEQEVDLTADGRIVLFGTQRLAGSGVKMHEAIANTVAMANVSLSDAIEMATVNPARIINLENRMEGLAVGQAADFVLFRFQDRIEITSVYRDGERAA